jgi:hypothetical protein
MAFSGHVDLSAIRLPSSVTFLLFVAIVTAGITCATIFGPMALPPGSKLQCEVVPR